ncbi:MAG: hypothetical protein Q9185_005378 [Variospora sp. 1 TL-2023]
MASPALSQASTAFESDAPQVQDPPKGAGRAMLQRAKEAATAQDILLFLIALRILNALSIRTFFQPDEYFQSLEPAWQIAFGADSGAWITWEWKTQLRSAIHPALFAAVYCLCVGFGKLYQLSPMAHGDEKVDEYGLRQDLDTNLAEELAKRERLVLIFEAAICGSLVLAISAIADRLFYQQWVFPPFRFLYFNLARSLSVHYGRNDWHYYLSQGFPLLLTTFLPFAIIGLYQSLFPQDSPPSQPLLTTTIKRQLATTSFLIPFALSFISHKEVRFIYPLLPPLHVLSAAPFTAYFLPLLSPTPRQRKTTSRHLALNLLLSLNLLLAIFTTQLHQTAPLTVLTYLRSRDSGSRATTVAFLTPCHSTPWRSHLLHSSTLKAWALSCEPPLHLPPSQHSTYLDEADQFYQSPSHWLSLHLGRPPKNRSEQEARLVALEAATGVAWNGDAYSVDEKGRKREKKKAWTGYLVFFEQLEGEMKLVLKGTGYGACWRGWNGWVHDDWRRRGEMVVWCLDDGEKTRWKQEVGRRQEIKGWWGRLTTGSG